MKLLITFTVLIALIGLGTWFFLVTDEPVATTNTNLSPTASTSEVAATTQPRTELISAVDPKSGIAFEYPQTLSTEYIEATMWPPTFINSMGAYNCTVTEQMTAMSGYTSREEVYNQTNYCIWERSENTAGSEHKDYQITFPQSNQYITMGLILRQVQCANFPEPEATICQQEQASFDLLETVDLIARSARLPQ